MAQYACSKCEGKGRIQGFTHVQNGVCFRCGGTGKQASKPRKQVVKPLTPYQQAMVERITTGTIEDLGYADLKALRDFAYWPMPQHPELLTVWRDRGEAFFQAAQDERLAALY